MHRKTAALLAALAIMTLGSTTVLAREPVAGHNDHYPLNPGGARRVLDFHFPAANPTWFDTHAEAALETSWDDPVANNSNVPQYSDGENASGGGTITYNPANASPCTGSTIWIGCNPASGLTAFNIHVRSLPSSGAPTWLWYHRDNTCNDVYPADGFNTNTCFSVYRVLAHESEHNTLTRLHVADAVPFTDSIMQSATPTSKSSADYWNRSNFLRCDLAGAQLEYGLANLAGKYADCFASTPGDGAKGLNTTLTITTGASYSRCFNAGLTVSGRFALTTKAAYVDLSNAPLQGRVLKVEKKPITSPTWQPALTTAATGALTGTNWSARLTATAPGSWNYRASWATSAAETALNSSNVISWTVIWTSAGCPTIVSQ